MTPELLNKLKHLANIAAHLPADVTLEDEDAALKALHGELAADTVLELIAIAERTTAPVTIPDTSQDWANLDGAVAWHLIERHADSWSEVGNMMESWLAARMAAAPAPIQQDLTLAAQALLKEQEDACLTDAMKALHEMELCNEQVEVSAKLLRNLFLAIATPPALAGSQVQAAGDVLAERERQKQQEGWTAEHDDQYEDGELCGAAACYTMANDNAQYEESPNLWPWPEDWWKPTTKRRNLVKAGALILAEIERLDRAAMREQQP